jgi:hypothetical protein
MDALAILVIMEYCLKDALVLTVSLNKVGSVIMHSLQEVHEMNAYRAGQSCPSLGMIQIENFVWTSCQQSAL